MTNYPPTFRALVLGILLPVGFLTVWEIYWRTEDYPVAPDAEKALWAYQRARLENLDSTGVVILGSSRVLFDIQLDEWEEVTGT